MAGLFKNRIIKEKLKNFEIPEMQKKIVIIQNWKNSYDTGELLKKTETQCEQSFNNDFFVKILGYKPFPSDIYTIQPKDRVDSGGGQIPDATLGYFNNEIKRIVAVVEIKDANTSLDRAQHRLGSLTPIQQGFKYKPQYKECGFVIVTNFFEIRLFRDNQMDYEKFTINELLDEKEDYFNFRKFFYLLCSDNFVKEAGQTNTEKLLSIIRFEQEQITNKFYKEYKRLRENLIKDIVQNNVGIKRSGFYHYVVEKAQKIVDRIVLICFFEDCGLLPENKLKEVVNYGDKAGLSIWSLLKDFFNAVDSGSSKMEIPEGYNGELFKEDSDLNNLKIGDEICKQFVDLTKYDFREDLSINILGHIFEQSISDLEKLRAYSKGEDIADESENAKRKKDGIYYTPEYIVDYIVKNSLGKYLEEKEFEILNKYNLGDKRLRGAGFDKRIIEAYGKYYTLLRNIKVLDPACGSGAFLVKVYDYLLAEHKRVFRIVKEAEGKDLSSIQIISDDDYIRPILENNIYGVDLNPESVEITKLSLWLKSAKRGKKLINLKQNIKCGNSLVDSTEIDPERTFDWNKEFPDIMNLGGFDVIVMNPPYVDSERMTKTMPEQRDFLASSYKTAKGNWDLYIPFMEKALNLLKFGGYSSFITPDKWLAKSFGLEVRKFLLPFLIEMVFAGRDVFNDANVDSIITILKKKPSETLTSLTLKDEDFKLNNTIIKKEIHEPYTIDHIFSKNLSLLTKIDLTKGKISDIAKCESACSTSDAYKLKPFIHNSSDASDDEIKIINTGTIDKYNSRWGESEMTYLGDKYLYPVINLDVFKNEFGNSYYRKSIRPKIIIKGLTLLDACEDIEGKIVPGKSTLVVCSDNKDDLMFLLPFINSKLPIFYIKNRYISASYNTGINFTKDMINNFPIPTITQEIKTKIIELGKEISSSMIKQRDVDKRFKKLVSAEVNVDLEAITRLKGWWNIEFSDFIKKLKVHSIDINKKDSLLTIFDKYKSELQAIGFRLTEMEKNLNGIIYELYNLTAEEINVIESSI